MFFILSKMLGFFALPSNILISIGLVGLVLLCTRFRRLGQLARGHQPRAHRLRRLFAARQRFDPAAGAALPAVGRVARPAGRHRRARRRDLAGHFGGARRRRAQRSGRAHHRHRRACAPLSECAHHLFRRHRVPARDAMRRRGADRREGIRGARRCARSHHRRRAIAQHHRERRVLAPASPNRSRASAGSW